MAWFQSSSMYDNWFKQQWGPAPPEYWQMMGASAGGMLTMMGVSSVVSPFIWGPKFDLKKKGLWHATFTAIFFQIFITVYMWEDMVHLGEYLRRNSERPFLAEYQPTVKNWKSAGAVFGYVIFDLLMMVIDSSNMQKSMGRPLWMQMIGHHIGVLVSWPYALHSSVYVIPVVYYLFTESTSTFMNIRWCAGAAGYDRIWLASSIMFLITYTVIRMIPVPFVIYYSLQFQHQYATYSYFQMLMLAIFAWVPIYLNVFWYSLIVKGFLKFLRKGASTSSSKDEDKKKA